MKQPISKGIMVILFIVEALAAKAQQFGGVRPSVKWKQINSKAVRVIFPEGEDSVALRIVNIIDYLDANTLSTIGFNRKKINLVLHDQTTISNAYVGLGPFRSEFYLTPVQNTLEQGAVPWPDQLASHEYRHVQQYNNFNVGISKTLGILFGQEGRALANDGSIPNWFFEGDAVYNETNVSRQGRGRLPYFFKDYKALWLANRDYSYMKLRNGSLKDFTPDHYALGYQLVAYGYQQYGPQFWQKVTRDAAAYKGLVYPFQNAIAKYAGVSFSTFKNNAFNFFGKDSLNKKYPVKKVVNFKNQEYPTYISDSNLIWVENTYKKVPAFHISGNGTDRIIRTKDVSIDNYYSYKNNKIIYAAYQPNIRWGFEDYSDLKLLDINTGKETGITKHTKYFSPDLNINASKIVAVNVIKGLSNLAVIDMPTGTAKVIPNPHNYFYTYPKFINDDSIIAAVRNNLGQMAMILTDVKTTAETLLTPFSYNVIAFPVVKNDTLYFTSSFGKEDRLMAISIKDKKVFILSIADATIANGYYQPAVSDHKLAVTTFTDHGFEIVELNKNTVTWNPVSELDYNNATTDFGVTVVNSRTNTLSEIKTNNLPSSRYHKTTDLFNFHSVEPNINDPVYTLNFIGENVLNTLQSQLSLAYDRNEGYKKASLSFVYGALFPYLSAGLSYTFDRSALVNNKIIYFNETEPFAGINFPLNLSKGRSLTFMNVGTQYTLNHTGFQAPVSRAGFSYSYLANYFSITNQVQQARQEIYPKFAQSLSIKYNNVISKFSGQQLVVNSNIYLPGLFSVHSLLLNMAFLFKDTSSQVSFASGFPFSRGYTAFNFNRMYKAGVNYQFPIAYPDAGFAQLVYLLRVRSNLFYDATFIQDYDTNHQNFNRTFRSAGIELFFDTKWFNQAPINFGLRFSHLLDNDILAHHAINRWELILPINIFHN